MKKLISKLKIIVVLTIVLSLSVCNEDGEATRYKSIEIPAYTTKDYTGLLDSKNNEVVYNSVCNLVESAPASAMLLSNDTIDKSSADYLLAKEMYEKISDLLYSKDEWVVGSSILFMNNFGSSYLNKKEIVDKLLKITNSSRNIQFEKLQALISLYDSNSIIETKHIEGFYSNKSWLVSRASYSLINKSENSNLRHKLIEKYKTTKKEYEKLLILSALRSNYDKKTFDLLTEEIINNSNKKIRKYILEMLDKAKDKKLVLEWIDKHYSELTEESIIEIAENSYSEIETAYGSSLFIVFMNNGFNPKQNTSNVLGKEVPKLFNSLYETQKFLKSAKEDIENDTSSNVNIRQEKVEIEEVIKNLKSLEKKILGNDNLKDAWLAYKDRKSTPKYPQELIDKYKENINKFIVQTESLFEEYEIDKQDYSKYVSSLRKLKDEDFDQNHD